MNNKPVAIVNTNCENNIQWCDDNPKKHNGYFLYTHPVKEYKEPSVKEIHDLWLSVVNHIPANDHRPREWHFARAILRKASER